MCNYSAPQFPSLSAGAHAIRRARVADTSRSVVGIVAHVHVVALLVAVVAAAVRVRVLELELSIEARVLIIEEISMVAAPLQYIARTCRPAVAHDNSEEQRVSADPTRVCGFLGSELSYA